MFNSHKVNYSVKGSTLAWVAISALLLQLVSPAVFNYPIAQATTVIDSVTLNGGATVEVTPGDPIDVVVNVSGIGVTPRPHWKSTSYQFGSGSTSCVDHPNHTTGGTAVELFTVEAPLLPGTYDLTITVYHAENCNNSQDFYTLTLTSVVIVVDQFTLSVSKDGSGTGTVTSSPIGIDCGSDCSEAYDEDTNVTLTATPDLGSTFDGWGGDCSEGGIVTMSGNKACTAEFNLEPPTTGTLRIVKNLVEDNGGNKSFSDFSFQVNGGEAIAFEEDGDNDLTVVIASYTVTEIAADGYTTTYDNCTDVSVTGGGTTVCTITNDDIAPTVTINKTVTNDNGGTADTDDFSFFLDDGLDGVIELFHGVATQVTAGLHTVSEDSFTGYTPSIWSDDCAEDGSLTLLLGQDYTCTITNNDDAPSLTLIKYVVGGEALASYWTLTATGNQEVPVIISGEGEVLSGTDFQAGTYTLSEVGPSGYSPSGWSCVGGNQNGNQITLAIGESATCSITNTFIPPGSIVVVKNSIGGNGTFNFTSEELGDFNITTEGGSGSQTFSGLEPALYSVSETGMPDDWDFTDSVCVSSFEDVEASDSLNLDEDETITCTFTNTYTKGMLIVEKILPNDDGGTATPEQFSFSVNGGAPIPFESDGVNELIVSVGTSYSVVENPEEVAGFLTSYENCGEIEIGPGETKTCTITNDDKPAELGAIHGYKWNDTDSNGERGEEELLSGWTIFIDENANGQLDGEEVSMVTSDTEEHFGWYWFNNLPYGEYSVCEVNQTYWTKTYPASCHTVTLPDGNPNEFPVTSNAILGPEYNFGNHYVETSDLSVTKDVDDSTPDVGQTITFTIAVSNSGPDSATGVVVNDNLPSSVTFVSASPSQGTYDDETGEWTVGELGSESSATLTITVTVNSGTAGNTITNTATATSEQSDPNEQNSADSQDVTVNGTVVISGGGGGGGGGIPALYIHNELLGASTDTSVTITWNTNLEATSRVVYGPTSADSLTTPNYGYTLSTLEDMILSTFHTMVITGLTPGTQYFFRPVSAKAPVEVRGVELTHSTTGEVAGEQTQTTSSLPADESGTPNQPSGPDNSESLADDTGIVAGVETQELAQAPEEDFSDLAPISAPAPETSETKSCNPWGWALVILNVIAAAWFWKKYSKSQKWNKYLWLINLGLTAVLTWLWLGNCAAWMWLLVLLIVTILYTLFTSEKGSTPAQA